MITLNNTTKETTYTVEKGMTLLQISKEQYPDAQPQIAAALYNNEFVGLQTKVQNDGDISWFSLGTLEGNQCMVRTATMLLTRAVSDLYPHGRVFVKHALRKALYCELDIGHSVTVRDVASIKRRMDELVAQDAEISQVVISAESAMDMCRNRHLDREAELLRYVNVKQIMAYQCGPVFDYYMGPLLPSMGYLTCFNLRSYAPGVILETPTPDHPDTLPPYKEIPKMARLFLDAEEWGRIVRCEYVSDLNRYIADDSIQDIVDMAEALQEKKLAQIADYVVTRRPKIKVILIAGPSSAGKTTFCKRLTTQLRVVGLRPVKISLDDYFTIGKIRPKIRMAVMILNRCGPLMCRCLTSRLMSCSKAKKSIWHDMIL